MVTRETGTDVSFATSILIAILRRRSDDRLIVTCLQEREESEITMVGRCSADAFRDQIATQHFHEPDVEATGGGTR